VRAYANANTILRMINRTIGNKHSDIMVKLYKSLVHPHVEYCTAAWLPYYELIEKITTPVYYNDNRIKTPLIHIRHEIRSRPIDF